jgi:hypothetical protein
MRKQLRQQKIHLIRKQLRQQKIHPMGKGLKLLLVGIVSPIPCNKCRKALSLKFPPRQFGLEVRDVEAK